MNENQALLFDTAERLFKELASSPSAGGQDGATSGARWRQFEEVGLSALLVPEALGGFGGGAGDAWLVFHLAGQHAIDLPVVEAILAADVLAGVALEIPSGVLTIAPVADGRLDFPDGAARFTGSFGRVPWGRSADHVVAILDQDGKTFVVSAPVAGALSIDRRHNAADEPRDTIMFGNCPVAAAPASARTAAMASIGALARAAQIGGACRGALDLTRTFVGDRSQFGRPLAKFQAVQHQLATLAEHTRAAEATSRSAFEAFAGGGGLLEVASAKIIANKAAEQAVAIAHQSHGAIGFTWEYALHPLTRRLIAWSSEFGNTRYWESALGAMAAVAGPDGFWPMIVDGSRR